MRASTVPASAPCVSLAAVAAVWRLGWAAGALPSGVQAFWSASLTAAPAQACVERIKSLGEEAHCTGQYFDYYSCIDKCVRACPVPRP